jgi:uncharacterized protein YbaR (Trm112 family)
MNVKKIKRKCAVKGCRNVETFTISKVRDFGDTVLICPTCLEEALQAIKDYDVEKPKKETIPPPAVFYNHLISPSGKVDEPPPDTKKEFICPKCGKVYGSQSGLTGHLKTCGVEK